jgi:hypothetical protein
MEVHAAVATYGARREVDVEMIEKSRAKGRGDREETGEDQCSRVTR